MTRILVAGKTGQVGSELRIALAPLGTLIHLDRRQMDLCNPDSMRDAIRNAKPDIILNAAGYTTVDKAESEPDLAMQVNGIAPGIMAEEAKRAGALLVHYSTDYVYDGELDRLYTEDDAPNPVNAYGRSKLAGERAIQEAGGAHLILRTSWVYSARGTNFVLTILRLAREKPELSVVNDQAGSPTWARALAEATADLLRRKDLILKNTGIYHLSAAGHTSRYEFAKAIIRIMRGVSGVTDGWASVKPITSDRYPLPAKRPCNPVTNKDKIKRVFGIEMPRWEDQLRAFLAGLSGAANRERRMGSGKQ
ncbi:MAG: dTDP-4-dehydrorhamnose reductase [Betaproteobacteria bacterium]|nr:dTDP-4-dehydrorhamnose reductase [Betaproteobacteria bacterium]